MSTVVVRGRATLNDGTVVLGSNRTITVTAPAATPFPLWKPEVQIGMSTPQGTVGGNVEGVFEQRETAVEATGGQLRAQRIFAWLNTNTADLNHDRILYAKSRGFIPDISWKVTGSPSDASVRSWFERERDWLLANGITQGVVMYHHEPRPDIPAADFVRRTKIMGEVFRPYPGFVRSTAMTGWILEAPGASVRADFDNYMPTSLFVADTNGQVYIDSPGIDAYEEGDIDAPLGTATDGSPASRMRKFAAWADSKGIGHLPLSVHEFNGYRGATFDWVYDYLFTEGGSHRYWLAMLWNATTGKGYELTTQYDRLGRFQRLLKKATDLLNAI